VQNHRSTGMNPAVTDGTKRSAVRGSPDPAQERPKVSNASPRVSWLEATPRSILGLPDARTVHACFSRDLWWAVKTLGLTPEEPYPVFMPFANRQPWGPYRDLSKRLGRRPYSSAIFIVAWGTGSRRRPTPQVGICHRVLWLKAICNLDSGTKEMLVQPLESSVNPSLLTAQTYGPFRKKCPIAFRENTCFAVFAAMPRDIF